MTIAAKMVLITALAALQSNPASPVVEVQEIAPRNPADATFAARIDGARMDMETGQYANVVATLKDLPSDPDYPKASASVRFLIDDMLGIAATVTEDWGLAHDAMARVTSSPSAADGDWVLRLSSARWVLDYQDAYAAFEHLRVSAPDKVARLDDGSLSWLDEAFGSLPDQGARFGLEQVLDQQHWGPSDPNFSPDVIRFHYATGLLQHGEAVKAQAVMRTISDPEVLLVAQADQRFTPGAAQPDLVKRAAERRLAERRAAANADPDWVYGKVAVADSLMELGRYQEALDTAKAATDFGARTACNHHADQCDYRDAMELGASIQAFALFRLGRHEEALGVARSLPNANRFLFSADLLSAMHDPAGVLAALEDAESATIWRPGQLGHIYGLRACAAHQAGRTDVEQSALAQLQSHPNDSPEWRVKALLCTGDVAGAASATIKLLDDANKRHLALEFLQDRLEIPNATDAERQALQAMDELRSRKDVQQAIAAVGTVRKYDLAAGEGLY